MLDGDVGELFKDLPCCRCVNVIIKDDLIDLTQQSLLIQILQRSIQLERIGVFTIDNNIDLLAFLQKLIDPGLREVAGICYFAQIAEVILIGLIQQGNKLLVIVKNIACIDIVPVHVDLIGILAFIGIVFIGSRFDPIL